MYFTSVIAWGILPHGGRCGWCPGPVDRERLLRHPVGGPAGWAAGGFEVTSLTPKHRFFSKNIVFPPKNRVVLTANNKPRLRRAGVGLMIPM